MSIRKKEKKPASSSNNDVQPSPPSPNNDVNEHEYPSDEQYEADSSEPDCYYPEEENCDFLGYRWRTLASYIRDMYGSDHERNNEEHNRVEDEVDDEMPEAPEHESRQQRLDRAALDHPRHVAETMAIPERMDDYNSGVSGSENDSGPTRQGGQKREADDEDDDALGRPDAKRQCR